MHILKTAQEVWAFRSQCDPLALVPTMGFLHEGHLSLMREGVRRSKNCAVSLFVNPTQFGPKEDLSRYPRDLSGDLAKCESVGVIAVYVPEVDDVYPKGYQTYVSVEGVSQGLDGASRPGHFRGVATVVTQLLALFRPQVALFGEKDFQQLKVIEALARDLRLGVEVVGMPIIRETDGLAMSSRNSYLTADERKRALSLSRGLFKARDSKATDAQVLKELVGNELKAAQAREDYVAIVDAKTLEPLEKLDGRPARALVAAFVGNTRLIDNIAL